MYIFNLFNQAGQSFKDEVDHIVNAVASSAGYRKSVAVSFSLFNKLASTADDRITPTSNPRFPDCKTLGVAIPGRSGLVFLECVTWLNDSYAAFTD